MTEQRRTAPQPLVAVADRDPRVVVPPETREALRALADATGMSIAQLVARAVKRYAADIARRAHEATKLAEEASQ